MADIPKALKQLSWDNSKEAGRINFPPTQCSYKSSYGLPGKGGQPKPRATSDQEEQGEGDTCGQRTWSGGVGWATWKLGESNSGATMGTDMGLSVTKNISTEACLRHPD